MPATKSPLRAALTREAAIFTGLLFLGFVLLPIAAWFAGRALFGDYGGSGYGDFFGTLSAKVRSGDRVAWFLILSPYLAILTLRLTIWGWRKSAHRASDR